MSKSPEQFGGENPEAKKEALRDQLEALIKTIAKRPHLKVVTELTPQELFREMAEGRDPSRAWFWQQTKDQKTGKIIEEKIHLPEEMMTRSENFIRGVAAHEAGHSVITRWPDIVPPEVLQQPGFNGMMTALEERPTDQVVRDRYPGAGEWLDEARREMFAEGEVAAKASKNLGYFPKFLQLCDLLVYEPHTQGKNEHLDPEVLKIYEKIRGPVENYEHTLPVEGSNEGEILEKTKERYKIAYRKIWPEIKEMVEQDQGSEELREMVNQHQQEILEDLQEQLREELQEAIDQAMEAMAKEAVEEKEKEKSGKGSKGGEDQSGKEGEKSEEGEEGEPEVAEPQSMPLPMDQLSSELTKALKKSFDKLSKEQKEALREKAKKNLEKLEDDLVNDFSGKISENPPETHERYDKRLETEKKEEKSPEERREEKERQERIEKEMKEAEKRMQELKGKKSHYEDVYQQIKDLDEVLYRRLEEVFSPNVKSEVKLRSSGAKLNLPAVFRWEAEKAVGQPSKVKIFESVTMPEPKDYAVMVLVDLSVSMRGEKMEETFKTTVLLSEVMNRLGIQNGVFGFSNNVMEFKHINEKLTDKVRAKIGDMHVLGNTFMGEALMAAAGELDSVSSREKFLLILTDGGPSDPGETNEAVNYILNQTDQKLIALGLGRGTAMVKDYFPVAMPNLTVKDLSETLGNLLEDLILHPDQYKSGKK
ncbi:MAG: VWA domain-containing protein [Patescibacteria group bacterium]